MALHGHGLTPLTLTNKIKLSSRAESRDDLFINNNFGKLGYYNKFEDEINLFLFYALITLFILAEKDKDKMEEESKSIKETATFGSGCFWCTEAVFERLKGVHAVVSGYAGGNVPNPTYEAVCTGKTGHAEVCQITFDPNVISYDELLKVFWKTHDPTTLNRQGNDVGTQYRSVIYYHNEKQKERAELYKNELNKSGAWNDPVVTSIEPYKNFYKAEDYHQHYFEKNPYQSYCSFVIAPKVEKFQKVFQDILK